jgi:Divergent InlB B-repeat domain
MRGNGTGTRALRASSVLVVAVCGLAIWAAAASANIFWTDSSANNVVGQMNLDGSGVNPGFICGATNPVGMAVDPDSNYVYWVNGEAKTIGRANINGTGVNQSFVNLSSDPSSPAGVAVSNSGIYWVNSDGSIGDANLSGVIQSQTLIGALADEIGQGGIAVTPTNIYWTLSMAGIDGQNEIETASLDTDVASQLVATSQSPFGLAIDDNYVYWSQDGNTSGSIGRANIADGSNNTTLVSGLGSNTLGVAVSTDANSTGNIYWVGNGEIGTATLTDGSASNPNSSLSDVGGNPVGIAVTAGNTSTAGSACSGSGGGGGTTPQSYTLTVSTAGSGSGSVTSNPAGISCPGTCSATYVGGDEVTMSETPAAGSTFAGWSGVCSGTAPCTFEMGADESLTATFNSSGSPGSGGGGSSTTPPPPPSGTVSSASGSSSSATGTATAANAGTTATAVGTGALTVSQYASDPAGAPSFASAGEYFDVEVASGSSFSKLTISNCNLDGGTTLEWWNGKSWAAVSPQTYTAGPPACASATLGTDTTPSLSQLNGTVFAVTLHATAAAGGASTHGSTASVPVTCKGGSRSTCALALTLTAVETIKKGKVTAVAATDAKASESKTVVVVLGTATVSLTGGQRKTLSVSLDRAGKRLLAARHRLPARLTIKQSGAVVAAHAVTFRAARK